MTKAKSFEDSLTELEIIVNELENGELGLDESIDLFEKGIRLSQKCSKQLDAAQKKVSMIIEKNGDFEEVPFLNAKE